MDDMHPAVLAAIPYLANTELGLQHFAKKHGVSKQAFHKQVKKVTEHLKEYGKPPTTDPLIAELKKEVERLSNLTATLRRQLIISNVTAFLLNCFKERVLGFFPKYELKRFKPLEKKYILDMAEKFSRAGGGLKEFCKAIGKSHETINDWRKRFERHGIAGLADKTTRPKHFSNKIPGWVKNQLIDLFLRFPQWQPWQYYKYMAHNPAIQWHVSLPVIEKLKTVHKQRRDDEIARIKKRWCFEPGSMVWTIDFTTIIKTDRYQLWLLTISDHRSRFFFATALFFDVTVEQVMDHLENLFIKYGKPYFIKADNGPEFRLEFREQLSNFTVNLVNSPVDYGQFNGSHERLHRTLKSNITKFSAHRDICKLVFEIDKAREDLNHHSRLDYLDGKTPFEIYFGADDFIPDDIEVVKPYEKDGELRMKFTNRMGEPARIAVPAIDQESTT